VLILVAAFIPLVSPSYTRLMLLLAFPLSFYVTEGLSKLKTVHWKRHRITLFRIAALYLLVGTAVLSGGFMLLPPEHPLQYFRPFIYQIPTSMLQNTVSIEDCPDVANVFQWYKNNIVADAVMISHRVFYGWALLSLNKDQVILYEYADPADAAANATQEGHSQIYFVWWVAGEGWHGLPTVPSVFQEVYHSRDIALYRYNYNATS